MKTRIQKRIIDTSYLEAGVNMDLFDVTQELEVEEHEDLNETRYKPPSQAVTIRGEKLTMIEKKEIKIRSFREIIKELPRPGERTFIIGGGNIDAIHSIHLALDFLKVIKVLYIATWSFWRANIEDILELFDIKKILSLNILLSMSFRGRYKADYAYLVEEMQKRDQRLVICENHSKVILMEAPGFHLVVDGSANFTANPRIEQINFTNSKQLYGFNRDWMETVFEKVYGKKEVSK